MGFRGTDYDLSCTWSSDSHALRKMFCQLCLMVILYDIQMLTWLLTALTCLDFSSGIWHFWRLSCVACMRQAILYLLSVVEGNSASFTHCSGGIKTIEGGCRQSNRGFGHPLEVGPQILNLLCKSIFLSFYLLTLWFFTSVWNLWFWKTCEVSIKTNHKQGLKRQHKEQLWPGLCVRDHILMASGRQFHCL